VNKSIRNGNGNGVIDLEDSYLAEYRRRRPKYSDFCEEIKRILEKSLEEKRVRNHSIDARAKSIESFQGKLAKKKDDGSPKYTEPFQQITDLAGVRVIAYTLDEVEEISAFVDDNFIIMEKRDVGEERIERGEFGYQSIHYLVKMTEERLALPDYKAFQGLICEIQIRTVLQHAWAEMEHDIQYKGSQNIPASVKRKFLSLAGLLEIADREFSSIQREDKSLKQDVLSDLQKDLTRDEISRNTAGDGDHSTHTEAGSGAQVRALLAKGRIKDAIEIYDEKITREPMSYTLYVGRARAHFLLGNSDRALIDLDKAEQLQPHNPVTSSLRSKIKEGSLSAERRSGLSEANELMKNGDTALLDGRPEEAYSLYSDGQSEGASWPFSTIKMAMAGIAAGDLDGASLHLDELRIHPGTPMEINIAALKAVLSALREHDQFAEAIERLRELKEAKSDFNLGMSPVSLLEKLDGEKYWGGRASQVQKVFECLK